MIFRKYFEIAKINFINNLVYTWDVITSSLFVGLIMFIFVNLWKVVYSDSILISGYTIGMMLWYLVMTESIVTSNGHLIEEIGEEIKSGQVANYLNKPYNYISYKFSSTIGNTIYKFCLTFIISSLVVFIFLGGIKVNPYSIPLILLIVFLAMCLDFLISSGIGIMAFWLEDVHSMWFIYQKMVFTLGGMLLPLEIFPEWLGRISRFLPFSYIAYHPARLFVDFSIELFFSTLVTISIWILFFLILITIAYKICIKKVSINGG